MNLEHEFTFRTAVSGPHVVGEGAYGTRHYFEMTVGVMEGARLNAQTMGCAADWMLVGSDGFMRMDVRLQLAMCDGAVMLARYHGLAEGNDHLQNALRAGRSTDYDDQCIRTIWQLESGNPRYAWVNRSVFVGEGRACARDDGTSGFEHRVYRAA